MAASAPARTMSAQVCCLGVNMSTCLQWSHFRIMCDCSLLVVAAFLYPFNIIPGLDLFRNTVTWVCGFTVHMLEYTYRPQEDSTVRVYSSSFTAHRWQMAFGDGGNQIYWSTRVQLGRICYLRNLDPLSKVIFSYGVENENGFISILNYT